MYQSPSFPRLNTTAFLESLLRCQFSDDQVRGYLRHVAVDKDENRHLLSKNVRLWNSCHHLLPDNRLCFSPEYLETVCPRFPVKRKACLLYTSDAADE